MLESMRRLSAAAVTFVEHEKELQKESHSDDFLLACAGEDEDALAAALRIADRREVRGPMNRHKHAPTQELVRALFRRSGGKQRLDDALAAPVFIAASEVLGELSPGEYRARPDRADLHKMILKKAIGGAADDLTAGAYSARRRPHSPR